MNYRLNLIPDEYIGKSTATRGKLWALCLLSILVLVFFSIIYIYMLAVTADNQKEIVAYRQGGSSGGNVVPGVAEIRSQRREYEDRLKIVGPLYHRQVTTAIITEHLIKAIPPGVVLKELEIKNGSLEEAAAGGKKDGKAGGIVSSGQTISISGTSPSLEPLGIYLSGLQNISTLTDILLKEAVWDNGCYSFVIVAVVVTP